MSTSSELRKSHFAQFAKLPAEKQMAWSIGTAHSLWDMMSKGARKSINRFRNGGKKIRAST